MRRSNEVYFITLIDLLVQVIFLGLVLYVLTKANQEIEDRNRQSDQEKIEALVKANGVSNLTELTDELTKLAPIKELKGTADFISKAGGMEEARKIAQLAADAGGANQLVLQISDAKRVNEVVAAAGGSESIVAKLEKLRKFEEGSGKPPCLYTVSGDKKTSKTLATVVADDTAIAFQGSNPDLEAVLALLKKPYVSVERLSLQEFSAAFAPLLQAKPECRYTLQFIEKTNYVHARDAARFTFYLKISK